ncbi:MAG: MATE family efflux transporter [Eubacteriales bacterium]|nr:MATE family efflux transporter [Eubacteriales bacterium]
MQRPGRSVRPYLGDSAFYKSALAVMLPVTVQQLINNLFNMVDNLMVGSLDAEGIAMSAVTVANKPVLIYNAILFGLAGGAGLLISQYFGARNRKVCQGLFWAQMGVGLAAAALFFLPMFLIPEAVMRIYVSDARTIELGVEYLRIISFTYFPAAISGIFVYSLRSLGQNQISVRVSLFSMGVNALCNYVLIFGAFGVPAMGVRGAAWGTLIARYFEMGFYVLLMLRKRLYFAFEPETCGQLLPSVRRHFAAKSLPLIGNELLYSIGINIFFWCFARMDETALPALSIAEVCFNIIAVLNMGNASAVSVMIGSMLGAGKLEEAKENCKKLFGLTFFISVAGTALCIGLAFALPNFYTIDAELRRAATQVSCAMAVFTPLNYLYAFCFFCLRAGGETRSATLLDAGFIWAVPVPACLIMGFLLPGKLSMLAAVFIVYALRNLAFFPAIHTLKKGAWLRNITTPEEA